MSLSKIQNRLRTNSYRHPLEFAADMRRIITETYRYTTPKDPLVDLAGKLQSEFEMCFAKIDFQASLSLLKLCALIVAQFLGITFDQVNVFGYIFEWSRI